MQKLIILDGQRAFDGTRSTINAIEAGIMPSTATNPDARQSMVLQHVQRHVQAATAVWKESTRYDVYLNPGNYSSTTLIHEALHSATGWNDVRLAEQLTGVRYDDSNPIENTLRASQAISDVLAANGCGINASGY